MQESYEQVMRDPSNLLRPWAMDPERDGTLTCPKCLGVADFRSDEHAFVCRRCDARTPAPPGFTPHAAPETSPAGRSAP